MGFAVREEVVNDHADNGEEEDDESPEDLVDDGTLRLDNLDCGTKGQHSHLYHFIDAFEESIFQEGGIDLLQAIMSRTKTMNPMTPPPAPACHGFADCTAMGAASASMNMESWRKREMTKFIMLAVLAICAYEVVVTVKVKVKARVYPVVCVCEREECGSADGCCLECI